jgi:sec-independent protein translocase protein TatB
VFDLSIGKILFLAVIALVVFGPKELPQMAAKAGKALRQLRNIAEGAKNDLREGLGPEFADFEIEDLNPRHFVQKHLLNDLDLGGGGTATATAASSTATATGASKLLPGEEPPFDMEAT